MATVLLERLETELAAVEARTSNRVDDVSARLNSDKPKIELPGDRRLLSVFGTDMADILKDCGIYQRGGLAFTLNRQQDGLEVIMPQRLRTYVEQHLVCYRRKLRGHEEVRLERTMTESDAKGVLSSQQFLNRLPKVEKVTTARLPVMRTDGTIELLLPGYDPESLTLTLPQCNYDEAMP